MRKGVMMSVPNINDLIPPALLVNCACANKGCPNKILWIHKDRLISHSSSEVNGLVPIADFSPSDLDCLQRLKEQGFTSATSLVDW